MRTDQTQGHQDLHLRACVLVAVGVVYVWFSVPSCLQSSSVLCCVCVCLRNPVLIDLAF